MNSRTTSKNTSSKEFSTHPEDSSLFSALPSLAYPSISIDSSMVRFLEGHAGGGDGKNDDDEEDGDKEDEKEGEASKEDEEEEDEDEEQAEEEKEENGYVPSDNESVDSF